tara:strand:- start:1752 stop:2693 length:942 start_codon:yes stop_codon:yes gene_type:complete
MLKLLILVNLLYLPLIVSSQENNPLKKLVKLYLEESAPIYRVDFIVLKHLSVEDKEEKWPVLDNPRFEDNLIELSPKPELLVDKGFLNNKEPDQVNYQIYFKNTLSSEDKQDNQKGIKEKVPPRFYEKIIISSPVKTIVQKLKLSRGYRVLFESSWYQPVFSESNSYPVYIEALDKADKIYGQLNIYKDRYLHSEMTLRFSIKTNEEKFQTPIKTTDFNDILDSLSIEAKKPKDDGLYWINTILSQIKIRFKPLVSSNNNLNLIKLDDEIEPKLTAFYMDLYELQEERKMEENEFYYIDHPYFGVLIRLSLVK